MKKAYCLLIIIILGICTGCTQQYENNETVKIGYVGKYEEVPLFNTYEKGYFQDEGIKVELVKIDESEIKEAIRQKRIDAITCTEDILNWDDKEHLLKIGVGLTSSAIKIISSQYLDLEELKKNKHLKIGIENPGIMEIIAFENIMARYKGDLDTNDIQWRKMEASDIQEAVKEKEIDVGILAYCSEENEEGINVLYQPKIVNKDNAICKDHSGHSAEYIYINFAGIASTMIDTQPEKSAAVFRAWIQGTNDVQQDVLGAIEKAASSGYIDEAIAEKGRNRGKDLMWMPAVMPAKENLAQYIKVQKELGMIEEGQEEKMIDEIYTNILPFWD